MTPTVLATLPFRIEQVGGGAAMELTDGSIAMCVCTPAEVGEVDSGAASGLVVEEAGTVTEAAVMGIDAAVFCAAGGGCRSAMMRLRVPSRPVVDACS